MPEGGHNNNMATCLRGAPRRRCGEQIEQDEQAMSGPCLIRGRRETDAATAVGISAGSHHRDAHRVPAHAPDDGSGCHVEQADGTWPRGAMDVRDAEQHQCRAQGALSVRTRGRTRGTHRRMRRRREAGRRRSPGAWRRAAPPRASGLSFGRSARPRRARVGQAFSTRSACAAVSARSRRRTSRTASSSISLISV